MKEWFEKIVAKVTGKDGGEPELVTTVGTSYEVNLVPEVKMRMIKAQKVRNLTLFVCLVVSAVAVGAVVVLFGIKSGQDIAMASQDGKLEELSNKLNEYGELDDLVAIQGQLTALSEIADNKKLLSRVFGALDVMMPGGEDKVQLSELRINLEENTLTMEGWADAMTDPLIDYRVLESFKKGAALTKYDYGRFVDVDGKEIPSWCIVESDDAGNALRDGESYYAWWDLEKEGCGALPNGASGDALLLASDHDTATGLHYSADAEYQDYERDMTEEEIKKKKQAEEKNNQGVVAVTPVHDQNEGENSENNEEQETPKIWDVTRVKVWRTPQFDKWFRAGEMTEQGVISGVDHFASECITYTGTKSNDVLKWTSENDCTLTAGELTVTDSTNARNESGNLVLKFVATVPLEPTFFMFKNKHMIAIGPMGQNVTDSYVQIEGMFAKEAQECDKNDTDCLLNVRNAGGK